MTIPRRARHLWLSLTLIALALAPAKSDAKNKDTERVAVLNLKNNAGVKTGEISYLTQVLRQAANLLPTEHYLVMTKNNITELLPPNVRLEDCQGACAIETGRNVGAHWVLVGEVVRFGSSLRDGGKRPSRDEGERG